MTLPGNEASKAPTPMPNSRIGGIWDELPRPIRALAPMEDVTDTVFRRIVASMAPPDIYFTEFVNADGMCSAGHDAVVHRLQFTEIERPIIAQIWGNNPENYVRAAQMIVELGFDGIDINMGCPVKKIVKNGACSALIENPNLAAELYHAAVEGAVLPARNASSTDLASGPREIDSDGDGHGDRGGDRGEGSHRHAAAGQGDRLPVSIKTRIGFKQKKTEEWTTFLLALAPAALTIHGRIAKDMSDVPADWDEVRRVVEIRDDMRSSTPILGNGDIDTVVKLREFPGIYGVDGVMVGRGIFRDLNIFSRADDTSDAPWHTPFESLSVREKLDFYKRHIDLYRSTWGDEKNFNVMKKFAKPYVAGFSGASRLRGAIMDSSDYAEMLAVLDDWVRGL